MCKLTFLWLGIQDQINQQSSLDLLGEEPSQCLRHILSLTKKWERCIAGAGTAEFHFFSCLSTPHTAAHPATAPHFLPWLPRHLFLDPPPHRDVELHISTQEQQLPGFARDSRHVLASRHSITHTGQLGQDKVLISATKNG